jgi:hypothetical protein
MPKAMGTNVLKPQIKKHLQLTCFLRWRNAEGNEVYHPEFTMTTISDNLKPQIKKTPSSNLFSLSCIRRAFARGMHAEGSGDECCETSNKKNIFK